MHRRVLLRGGQVYSRAHPAATALAIDDGAIAWVGRDDGAAAYADGADLIVDLEGCLVTPAFVDGHVHLSQVGLAARSLDLGPARSRQDVLEAVAARARRDLLRSPPDRFLDRPQAPSGAAEDGNGHNASVLIGFGWDESRWHDAGEASARLPTAAELDRASGGRPVYLSRVDVHSALVSQALFRQIPDVLDCDGWDGRGRVEREAHHRVRDAVFAGLSHSDRSAALQTALQAAAAVGVGCLHEMSAPHVNSVEDLTLLPQLAGPLDPTDRHDPATHQTAPTVLRYWGEHAADGGVDRAREFGCVGAGGDLCADGAFGSRTAALTAAYADVVADHRGHLYLDPAAIAEHVVACTRAGVQAGFHCIGDAATAAVAEGLVRAEHEVGQAALVAARHRLEHAELQSAATVQTLQRYGVALSVQPAFDAFWGGAQGMYAARLGATRACDTNPLAQLADVGLRLTFGSDAPVTPIDPWSAVRAAAYHHVEAQRMSVAAAFAAHTSGGWSAVRRPEAWGEITVGVPARLAIWHCSFDSGQVAPDGRVRLPDLTPQLQLPECAATVVGTRPAYLNPQLCGDLQHW